MTNDKKGIAITLLCYIIWGVLPAYWNLLTGVNSLFILCCRIIFAFVFMIGVIIATGRLKSFRDTLKNKAAMRLLLPASVIISFNWGLYVWAVNNGHILDSSLGYYINPLIAFLLAVLLFREKYTKLQLAAVALAFTGVIISLIAFGSFPVIAVCIALSFAAYGALKKKVSVDPAVSIAIESMLIAPFALAFSLIFMKDSILTVSFTDALLLIGGGALTAIPLILYARAVNTVSFIIVAFFQYVSPSITMVYGLLTGEKLSASRIISFSFIGLGLVVFSIALIRKQKQSEMEMKEV